MRKKILLYASLILLFLAETVVFMLWHDNVYGAFGTDDKIAVLWHSLPHDLTIAGYVMALPMVLQLIYIWLKGTWHASFMRKYMTLVVLILLGLWVADLILFGHWGFRLDATAFVYLLDSPGEVLGQLPVWQTIVAVLSVVLLAWLVSLLMRMVYPKGDKYRREPFFFIPLRTKASRQGLQSLVALVLCGLLFVAIRGGVTESTMNVGRVYFSTEMALNHAATNPVFSLFYSTGKKEDFGSQYRFMTAEEADAAMDEMNDMPHRLGMDNDSLYEHPHPEFLSVERPNIVLIIFEGFTGSYCTALNPQADPRVMPNVNRMYEEGIGFTNFYANSWRTDRGMASILAAYPAQPTYTVMKNQQKCNNLQYLTQSLKANGYDLQFIYGGDVNFTNMKGFLTSAGIDNIIADTDFKSNERTAKWGVHDEYTFNLLYSEMEKSKGKKPFCKILLTLSSHQPYDVPRTMLKDEFCNSVAYADSCFGAFIDKLKASPQWKNTLVIGLPDHCANEPHALKREDPQHYHIPMFWTGGALKGAGYVNIKGHQVDLAATLLGQLHIKHDEFKFSNDIFDRKRPHFAFYDYPDGFGFLTDSCRYVQDNKFDGKALPGSHDPNGRAQKWGKAYLQKLYDDLELR